MKALLIFGGSVMLVLVLFLLDGLLIYCLWNWLMPEIFGLKTITFWQAVGLEVLTFLLFKNPLSKSSGSSSSSDSE